MLNHTLSSLYFFFLFWVKKKLNLFCQKVCIENAYFSNSVKWNLMWRWNAKNKKDNVIFQWNIQSRKWLTWSEITKRRMKGRKKHFRSSDYTVMRWSYGNFRKHYIQFYNMFIYIKLHQKGEKPRKKTL